MPVVNSSRERLGLNDGIIGRLYEFKEVGIKGELYSSELNRSFGTRHSVCFIKQDESDKFDFKINGVSHVNWFREKMHEFKEVVGIPKPRQNRSMKLQAKKIRDDLRYITDLSHFCTWTEVTLSKTYEKRRNVMLIL